MKDLFTHIRPRTLMLFLMAGLLPLITVSLVVYNLAFQATLKNVGELHLRNTQSVLEGFTQRVRLVDSRMQGVASSRSFSRSLQLVLSDPYIDHFEAMLSVMGAVADVVVVNSRLVDGVYVWSGRGNWLVGSKLGFVDIDYADTDWYRTGQAAAGVGGFVRSNRVDDGGVIWSKYYALRPKGLGAPSLVSVNLNLDWVASILSETLSPGSDYVLFNDRAILCGRYPAEDVGLSQLLAWREEQQRGGAGFLMDRIGNDSHILSVESSEYLGASLMIIDPYPLSGQDAGFLGTLPLLFLAALVMAIIILLFSASQLTKPIKKMLAAMRRVERHDLGTRIPARAGDHYYELYSGFNNMAAGMETMMEEMHQQYEHRWRLEYIAMRSQINAHFLYNTLDVIHWIASEYQISLIGDLTRWLANYYRNSLSQGRDVIPLAKAEAILRDYLQICQVKDNRHVDFQWDVPEELHDVPVLKYIFQPLAENAMEHGYDEEREALTLTVRVRARRETLEMAFTDDGRGLPPEELERVNGDLSLPQSPQSGFALWHINRHIQMFYGEAYGLEVTANDTRGVTVWIRIPAKAPEEAMGP